jgi:ring-1,2-phenylacetyl-CoA epoxidase subunit PaaC
MKWSTCDEDSLSMARLAQINVARMKAPLDDPIMEDFSALLDQVNAQAESAPGFVWRLKDETGNATTLSASSPFGADMLVNLSVWDSPEALKAFVYRNQDHGGALKRRTQWFDAMPSPHFVMWWLRDNELPSLIDAKRRLEYLAENGDSPYAFTYKAPSTYSSSVADYRVSDYILRLADDALIHSQRISEWCGHGPILEEDLALGNVALDYLGQARLLYSYVGRIEGKSRGEDDFAYFRNEAAFLNSSLVELPNSSNFGERDYAVTIMKLFLHSSFMLFKWQALTSSSDSIVSAVASKSVKECRYHFDHASQWVIRFGDGTAESKSRIANALAYLWPYTNEWFGDDPIDQFAAEQSIGPLNSNLQTRWLSLISPILKEATLSVPTSSQFLSRGKSGYHSESLSLLLAEMQSLARQHPGAVW